MLGVFMEGLGKNFRSRCKEHGTQTDLSMCGYMGVANTYGVQEHPFSESAILRYYKHPFLPYLIQKNAKIKSKIAESVEQIENYLESAQGAVKKGQPIQDLIIIQMQKDTPKYKDYCEKISRICKDVSKLVEKGANYANAIAKLFGICGYKALGNESVRVWMKFRKFLQEMVPYNTFTLEVIKDHEISYSAVSALFNDRKSYFYGGKEKFKTLLLSTTRFKFHMIDGRMMLKQKIDENENNFVKTLVENVENG